MFTTVLTRSSVYHDDLVFFSSPLMLSITRKQRVHETEWCQRQLLLSQLKNEDIRIQHGGGVP